ncbi:hypothetical protein [Salinicola sp. DM10]|uniref:ORC-CDC6 family AAA ATPase n=1 Tax=Salinicola sp. DM10 TaxID=2815721 RepID=UPI001A8D4FCF|nr:hypothetical protein [Salinicola sp. DM10]MCE3026393.1 hypothetical protein [Salinicola sp. DM10]
MIQEINLCLMRFEDRAERITPNQVADTFVQVGPLINLLESRNNQIMYGRRGAGKTHAMRFFQAKKIEDGDIAIFVDAQAIGSNGSIYNDESLPVRERATRLLVDVCSEMHHQLLEIFTDPGSDWDLSQVLPVLDQFVNGFTETRVEGETESQTSSGTSEHVSENMGITAGNIESPIKAGAQYATANSSSTEEMSRKKGVEESWIDFSFFSRSIRSLASAIGTKRLWVLIDEWTTIPPDIQPHLADMLRRSMFSVPNISLKVAAIEHRSHFKRDSAGGGYIGFELGADIAANINLDDYLVVDNDEQRAKEFFKNFVVNHARAAAKDIGVELPSNAEIINLAFTQENVFLEFVRATEGVPRDAMRILSLCAQKSHLSPISMPVIRSAAYSFFTTEKYSAINANPENRILLDWIRDEVIGNRQTRAFLLPVGTKDIIIDRLFDQRALHILNKSRSAAHRPGERFIVYKLDYGLYVDLINTDRNPQGLLVGQEHGGDIDFDVPLDDARSYRRAILDLSEFYKEHPEIG